MNRILGTLFAIATLAAIAYAIFNAGNYSSICFDKELNSEIATQEFTTSEGDINTEDEETTEEIKSDSLEVAKVSLEELQQDI